MSITLGVNTELWQTEWPIAVAAVQSLNKNIVWQDKPPGSPRSNQICWTGATKNLSPPRPATVDYFIYGDTPLGFAAALALAQRFDGLPMTNNFVWNGTSTQSGMLADQLAIGLITSPWGSLFS
jgi:hypothetical protein